MTEEFRVNVSLREVIDKLGTSVISERLRKNIPITLEDDVDMVHNLNFKNNTTS